MLRNRHGKWQAPHKTLDVGIESFGHVAVLSASGRVVSMWLYGVAPPGADFPDNLSLVVQERSRDWKRRYRVVSNASGPLALVMNADGDVVAGWNTGRGE